MPPICARLPDREFVGERLSGADAGEADPWNAIELEGQQHAMPVDRGIFREMVGDVQPYVLAFAQSDQRPWNCPVDGYRMTAPRAGAEVMRPDRQRDICTRNFPETGARMRQRIVRSPRGQGQCAQRGQTCSAGDQTSPREREIDYIHGALSCRNTMP